MSSIDIIASETRYDRATQAGSCMCAGLLVKNEGAPTQTLWQPGDYITGRSPGQVPVRVSVGFGYFGQVLDAFVVIGGRVACPLLKLLEVGSGGRGIGDLL